VSKETSPIFPAKLVELILLRFCTTIQLRDVIIYSGRRLNIFVAILYLREGVEFSVSPYRGLLWSWLLTLRIALPCIRVIKCDRAIFQISNRIQTQYKTVCITSWTECNFIQLYSSMLINYTAAIQI